MQGFFWLLLQMTLLLLVAAGVFLWLGWIWRGQKVAAEVTMLNASVDAESSAAELARKEKQEVEAALAKQMATAKLEAAELLEARERQRNLEREILRLAEEVKAVRQPVEPVPEKAAPAAATEAPTATAPTVPAQDVEPPTAPELPAEPAKPSRVTKVIVETKTTAQQEGRPTALAVLEAKIAKQQTLVSDLDREREGWQQKMDALKGKSANDPAGYAQTKKSLARSESQYREAAAALKGQQRQLDVLERLSLTPAPEGSDDLTKIKGIKTALDQQLRALGIHTYRQIALMSPDDLRVFSELLSFKNRAERDQWQRQARELHRAKYGADPA